MSVFSQIPEGAKSFCENKNININAKSKTPVKDHVSIINLLGNSLFGANSKDCNFLKNKKSLDNFVLIDARSIGARGHIPNSVRILSDHDDPEEHEFKKEIFEKKIKDYLKKKKGITNPDLTKLNYIIFCNGPTCYRTSWAACTLRKNGIRKDQLHLYLDGYLGIQGQCLKK